MYNERDVEEYRMEVQSFVILSRGLDRMAGHHLMTSLRLISDLEDCVKRLQRQLDELESKNEESDV